MPNIHPTAIIEDGAELAEDAVVGPFSYVGPNVRVGPGTRIRQGAILEGHTSLGARNQVHAYAVLGTVPQDLKYQGEPSRLEIGDENVIREHVTINIGTDNGIGVTRIGDRNLLMAGTHIAHDCVVGASCILANYTGLAGHVELEDFVTLGGQTGVHQFVRLGSHCMTSGGAKVGKDVPPYTIAQGYPAKLRGINQVGLRRRGYSDETIRGLRQAYRAVFKEDTRRFEEVLERVRADFTGSVEIQHFLDFLHASSTSRGFLRPSNKDEGNGAG